MTTHLFSISPKRRKSALTNSLKKYDKQPVSILYTAPDGMILVECGSQRFYIRPDELITPAKPIHGSAGNLVWNNDGTLRQ